MRDTIDRQTVIDKIKSHYRMHDNDLLELIVYEIENLPSVQPERKKGKWITDKYGCVVCSECKWGAPKIIAGCLANRHLDYNKSDYCWHCGADMKGEQDE